MIKKWLRREQIVKTFSFFGKRVIWLSSVSILSGVGVFALEFIFSISMQYFLYAMGLTSVEQLHGPEWAKELSLLQILIGVCVIFCGRSILQWIQTYVQYSAFTRFVHKLRLRLTDWVFSSNSVQAGEVANQFGERAYGAGVAVLFLQTTIFQVTVSVFLGIALFVTLPEAAMWAVGLLIVVGIPTLWLYKRIQKRGAAMAEQIKAVTMRLMLSIKNFLLIRIYSLEQQERSEHQKILNAAQENQLSYYFLSGLSAVLPQVLGIIVVSAIVYVMRGRSDYSPAVLLSYFYLFFRFLQNSASVSQSYSNFVFYFPNVESMAKWWAANSLDSPVRQMSNRAKEIEFKPSLPLGWRLEGIQFKYETSHQALFDNFNLEIVPGSCVVINGESGSGKSTLISILLDQVSVGRGQVQITDREGKAFKLSDVRSQFLRQVGYVGPEPFVFNGSIRENLQYGVPHAIGDTEIVAALKKAECQFIFEMSQKLDHKITDQGQGLSAGQKQRIALARALLRKPAVLVLDEATANLDINTEKSLALTLEKLKGQLTMVIVTHRDTLVPLADQMLTL